MEVANTKEKGLKTISQEFTEFLEKMELLFGVRKSYLNEKDRYENIRDYESAEKQIRNMTTLTFGAEINVLLITDRLYGCSKGLKEYLQNSTDITVDIVYTRDDAQKVIVQKPIDLLIIVGAMFGNKSNYAIIDDVKKINKYASIVMYASLDFTINSECIENGITHKYHRREPIDGFISSTNRVICAKTEDTFPSGSLCHRAYKSAPFSRAPISFSVVKLPVTIIIGVLVTLRMVLNNGK